MLPRLLVKKRQTNEQNKIGGASPGGQLLQKLPFRSNITELEDVAAVSR